MSLEPLHGSLSSRVGHHKDYRIYRSTPLSEPLRAMPPLARPVDASYYTPTPSKAPPSSTSSSSSSVYYRQRSDSFEAMLLAPSSRASFSYSSSASRQEQPEQEPETPFDAHLQAVYSGDYDMAEGLAFFESHGYYDVDDANTVAMFRENFGLTDLFWDKTQAMAEATPVLGLDDASDIFGVGADFPSVGTTLYRRHRTVSGRFELVDDDGNAVDDELEQERAREARLKSLALELDEFDLNELAHEQAVLVHAISAIRTETMQFQQYFSEAFREADATVVQCAPAPPVQHARRATLPSATPVPVATVAVAPPTTTMPMMTPSDVATAVASSSSTVSPPPQLGTLQQLPPYCGNVFLLKDTIPYLLRSWRKRWFYLDFNAGLLMMYKRSFWKSPRGVLDLRTVTKVERMNHSGGDFRLEFHSAQQPVMLLRTKTAEEAELWVNLLRFAKHHVGATPAPQLVLDVAATDMRANVLLEHKLKKQAGTAPRRPSNKATTPNEALAVLPSSSAPAAPVSASSRASSTAPAPSSSSTASTSRRRTSRNNVSSA